ncbi:MAG: hypothetical protein ACNA8W_03035 [Bradymonadaceae bacterium]
MSWTFTCWNCKTEKETITKVYRSHTCDHCDMPKHSCKNCKFYDPYAPNECREPMIEPVQNKEGANFCDYFVAGGGFDDGASKQEEARARLDALFKK